MADSIAEFARKVMEALGGGKAPPKREARKPEYTAPKTLEVALTRPEYGHQYSAEGKDLGVARSMESNSGTAPYKAGETMSGDRTLHNPTKLREKAPGEYYKAEKPENVELRTQEHLRRSGMQPAGPKTDSSMRNLDPGDVGKHIAEAIRPHVPEPSQGMKDFVKRLGEKSEESELLQRDTAIGRMYRSVDGRDSTPKREIPDYAPGAAPTRRDITSFTRSDAEDKPVKQYTEEEIAKYRRK